MAKRKKKEDSIESTEQEMKADGWTVVEVEDIEVEDEVEDVEDTTSKEAQVIRIDNVETESAPTQRMLYRHPEDKVAGGVCGGLANFFGIDPNIVRVLWAVATIATVGAAGMLGYLALWMLLPVGSNQHGEVRPAYIQFGRFNMGKMSYVLFGIGGLLLLSQTGLLSLIWDGFWATVGTLFWPGLFVGLGIMLMDRSRKQEWKQRFNEAGSSARSKMENRFQGKVNFDKMNFNTDSVRTGFQESVGQMRSQMPLRRTSKDRIVTGLCGGLGRRMGIESNLLRLGWVAATFFTGIVPGVVAYAILSLIIPTDQAATTTKNYRQSAKVQDVQIL